MARVTVYGEGNVEEGHGGEGTEAQEALAQACTFYLEGVQYRLVLPEVVLVRALTSYARAYYVATSTPRGQSRGTVRACARRRS